MTLPTHADVLPAFRRLRDAGFTLGALSNNPAESLTIQFDNAGLRPFFDQILAAASSGNLNPHPAPYRMAAAQLGRSPADILFVAAHGWDIAGAANARFQTAFIARPGQTLDPVSPDPNLSAPDPGVLADHLA